IDCFASPDTRAMKPSYISRLRTPRRRSASWCPSMYGASMPADACVAPRPVPRMSMTWTLAPREASSWATAHPMMPAPTTVTFTDRFYPASISGRVRRQADLEAEVRADFDAPRGGGRRRPAVERRQQVATVVEEVHAIEDVVRRHVEVDVEALARGRGA